MRMHLLIASVAILVLAVAPAFAAAPITADGNLSEWGVDPGNAKWAPFSAGIGSLTNVFWAFDDDTTQAWNSGREWYDIEAMYISLDVVGPTQYLSWAMVTSYPGMEPDASAVTYRNGLGVDYAYLRHPVLALKFNGTLASPFQYGIIMAPNSEGHPLNDVHQASNDALWIGGDVGTGRAAINTDTPELYDVDIENGNIQGTWRNGSTRGFGNAQYDYDTRKPVDFDPNSGTTSLVGSNGSVFAGRMSGLTNMTDYTEPNVWSPNTSPQEVRQTYQAEGSGWLEYDNFVWEGTIEFPKTEVMFSDYTDFSFFCATWCTNNDTYGDGITYRLPPPVPELGTWALLLATGALGGWVRRRRKD